MSLTVTDLQRSYQLPVCVVSPGGFCSGGRWGKQSSLDRSYEERSYNPHNDVAGMTQVRMDGWTVSPGYDPPQKGPTMEGTVGPGVSATLFGELRSQQSVMA